MPVFRIRRIFDDLSPANEKALVRIGEILKEQFPGARPGEAESIPEKLRNQLKYGFQAILFAAEKGAGKVHGFALALYDPLLKFTFLDYIAVPGAEAGGGLGGILYERVRKEALDLGCAGLFFECLPDDPELSRDEETRKQNAARLRFYERYGAVPVTGTKYETPLEPGGDNPPYLVFDGLGRREPLRREKARLIVAAILGKKYGDLCPPEYIRMVMDSFRDDPVKLRPLRYVTAPKRTAAAAEYLSAFGRVAMLDVDYHHGNGQQDIFYGRSDVLTVSLHGHPRFAYPYFSGFEDEKGEGEGRGFNLNLPLPEHLSGQEHLDALRRASRRISDHGARFLVVPFGGDTCKKDPTGTWSLAARDFENNGKLIGGLGLPVLVVQEGGYNTRLLGENVRAFFKGLFEASRSAGARLWSPASRDRRPARRE